MPNKQNMLEQAQAVMQNAYSPYSKFKVGCCIRTDKNNYYAGCNVECASYSITSCAESSAICQMVSAGETNIAEVLIISTGETPCPPCGACRQYIREFASDDTPIHCYGQNGESMTMTLGALLPASFGGTHFI
tara:strand:+ start:9831 stop:10229 length:399 start_codon:yes stop_codon:yes gene_type:complete